MPDHLRAIRLRVGSNVHRLRRARGLSQERLAELVGNSGKHVGQIERGEVNVGLDVLSRMAGALSVDVGDLFASGPRRRRADPPLFVVNDRELQQLERIVRGIRTARVRTGESAD